MNIALEIRGVNKSYGANQVLNDIHLTFHSGEFIALLGPNGAGKSTLIKILDGVLAPDSGELVAPGGDAHVIGVVHQDLGLVEDLTVAENMFLRRATSGRVLHPTHEWLESRSALDLVGLESLDPRSLVRDLPLGERALVAVARLWREGASVIVVDEVTANLPQRETLWLMDKLREAASHGATVVMVTHRLAEVAGHVDRVVVLADGRVEVDRSGLDLPLSELVRIMTELGRRHSVAEQFAEEMRNPDYGPVVLEMIEARTSRVGPVTMQLHGGEIVGVVGSVASGLHEIGYLAAGFRQTLSGSVVRHGDAAVRCVPAHREVDGVFPDQTVDFNIATGNWSRWRALPGLGLIKTMAQRNDVQSLVASLSIKPNRSDAIIGSLSGGNQQKSILARALVDNPRCVSLCEPTRGVDIATRLDIYRLIRELARRGTAILIVSSDLDDLAAVCHRLAVLGDDGSISDWVERDDVRAFCGEAALEQV
jgi:ABC-type sugar transport system ATPase subunit